MSATNEVTTLAQRVYLNAFPKAGTHLAELMVRQVATPVTERPWLGNLAGHAWLAEFSGKNDKIVDFAAEWPNGGYLKGHMAYTPDIAEALYLGKVCTIFVYRNLRDVAVSTVYHILDDRKNEHGGYVLTHPDKQLYRSQGDFEDVLHAVVMGLGKYPSLAARWQMFQPWLSERWVLPVRFEDMRNRPHKTASLILRYVGGQAAKFHGAHLTIDRASHDETVEAMVQATKQQKTATKRKGQAGGWVDYFTPRIETAWNESGAAWLNKELGYE